MGQYQCQVRNQDTLKQMKMKTTIQNLWDTGKANLRGKLTALQAYLKKKTNQNKTKKPSNKQSNFTFKGTRKRTMNKAQSEYKEGNNNHTINK